VDEKPIRLRCNIENPDAIVCFDPSLLGSGHLLGTATQKTLVLINSSRGAEAFRSLGGFRVVTIDAMAIARRNQLGRIVNTTLVGALLGLMDYADVELLKKVVEETSPAKAERNVAACLEGYRLAKEGGC
jgi:pyruvate ferredoxin oxidoreductase gamma subunit